MAESDTNMPRYGYSLLLYLLFPYLVFRLLWRGLRNHAYWRRWPERFGFRLPAAAGRIIWLHAVSVGEARAASPLVKALLADYPDHRILITTMTPTGSDQVRLLYGDNVLHCYVPYDYPGAVSRFIGHFQPVLALIMETELWPNLFNACHRRGIPIIVANVRLSEPSMRGYQKVGALARATLRRVSKLAVQTRVEAERLMLLGARPETVEVTGSIKFELNLPASLRETAEVLRRQWGANRPIWLAASTHEGEDEKVLTAYDELKKSFVDLLLVLVPRHPERFAAVTRLCRKSGYRVAQRSQTQAGLPEGADILVGDTMGELLLFCAACDVAFVGGSLMPVGGHNLLEPAALGKPAVYGPHMFNFHDISNMALERGAAFQVRDEQQLALTVGDLLGDANRRHQVGQAGRIMVEENKGALARTLAITREALGPQ